MKEWAAKEIRRGRVTESFAGHVKEPGQYLAANEWTLWTTSPGEVLAASSPPKLCQLWMAAFSYSPDCRFKPETYPGGWGCIIEPPTGPPGMMQCIAKFWAPSHAGWEVQVPQNSRMKPGICSSVLSDSTATFRAEPDPALQSYSWISWLLPVPVSSGEPVPFSFVLYGQGFYQIRANFLGLCCFPATCLLWAVNFKHLLHIKSIACWVSTPLL